MSKKLKRDKMDDQENTLFTANFDNFIYEIVSENPRRIKLAVSGMLDDIF